MNNISLIPGINKNWNSMLRMMEDFPTKFPSIVIDDDYELYEDGNNLIFKTKAAGFDKSDIKVELEEGVLTVSGENTNIDDNKEGKKYYKHMSKSSFTKSVRLPVSVSEDSIKAKFENGLLLVTMEKSALSKSKNIEIE